MHFQMQNQSLFYILSIQKLSRMILAFSYCAKQFHIEYKSTDNQTVYHET